MKRKLLKSMGIIMEFKHIPAGSADFDGDGKITTWDEKFKIYFIPLEDPFGKLLKYTVAPECVDKVAQKLENVCWGALIRLDFSGNCVTDIDVLADWLADYYESE